MSHQRDHDQCHHDHGHGLSEEQDCCSLDQVNCSPPAPILPQRNSAATIPAESCADDACGCHGGVPVFDGLDPRYKRVLWTVIAINGAMFLTEIAAGQLAGSQALKADALDFLADTVTYGLSLAVIGASLQTRAGSPVQGPVAERDGVLVVGIDDLPHDHPRSAERRTDGR